MNKLLTHFESKTNDFSVENRVAMAPMTRVRATEYRNVTDEMVKYYQQRSTAGLLITEGVIVSPEGRDILRLQVSILSVKWMVGEKSLGPFIKKVVRFLRKSGTAVLYHTQRIIMGSHPKGLQR